MFLPTNITLKLGDSGDFVTELQRRLAIVKCFNENAINGFFDGTTVNGVSQFQSMSGIRADGIAGPETLRRLNGSLSGDTSSGPDTKAEEEARQAAAANLQRETMMAQQVELQAAQQTYGQPAPVRDAFVEAAISPQPYPLTQNFEQPAQATTVQQQLQREMEMQARAQSGPSASDMLAQMLLSQTQQNAPVAVGAHTAAVPQAPVPHSAPQQPAAQQVAAHIPAQPAVNHAMNAAAAAGQAMQQPAAGQPLAATQHAPAAHQAAPVAPLAAAVVQHNTAVPVAAAAPAAEPRGIIGRATQFANEMVQKLSSYFEAKLPAPVLQEVKEIGHVMAQSGIKEVAIPSGPEQGRGADTPARAPQQQPAQSPQRH